jgi:SnoaL-like domain
MPGDDLSSAVAALELQVQRLAATQEIQNVMAVHELYHSANMHREEIESIWVRTTPGVALETVQGRFEGLDAVKGFYVEAYGQRGQYQLEQMRKQFPEIEDRPENEWIGAQVMHALTTPLIYVAGDGQSAKAIWISPGSATIAAEGKLRSLWYFDRYGVDFVLEDGQWKIWHMLICMDFVTPFERDWVDQILNPGETFGDAGPLPAANAQPLSSYKPYSPFEVAQLGPQPPAPYQTFSDTFSY